MRVIIITSSNNRSGGTRQAVYQAQGLSERGHEVTLCLPHNSMLWDDPGARENPLWHALPEQVSAYRADVETLLPAHDVPTIVHAFHNKAVKRLSWWGLFWRKRNLACVAHRGVIYRPGNPLPYLSPAMKAFIPNSEACAKAIGWCCPRYKIHVVPNGIPDDRVVPLRSTAEVRAELGLIKKTLVFVSVGNNNPAKGTEQLLRAFAAAGIPQARLILIGSTPERWMPLSDELGLADRVHILGHREHVSDYLQIADAFIFPSKDMDSAPNTLLEAIRMGLPIVATTVGGVPEIAQDNGLLIRPDDIPALTEALRHMAASPEKRLCWGKNSATRGQAYTVGARCAELEKIYLSVL